jgi:hypothetical protein
MKVARGPWSYMKKAEWEQILDGFKVEQRSDGFPGGHRWAVVYKYKTTGKFAHIVERR